jgi:uncharacterized protein involved in exopolysaccharide biosynthesis
MNNESIETPAVVTPEEPTKFARLIATVKHYAPVVAVTAAATAAVALIVTVARKSDTADDEPTVEIPRVDSEEPAAE